MGLVPGVGPFPVPRGILNLCVSDPHVSFLVACRVLQQGLVPGDFVPCSTRRFTTGSGSGGVSSLIPMGFSNRVRFRGGLVQIPRRVLQLDLVLGSLVPIPHGILQTGSIPAGFAPGSTRGLVAHPQARCTQRCHIPLAAMGTAADRGHPVLRHRGGTQRGPEPLLGTPRRPLRSPPGPHGGSGGSVPPRGGENRAPRVRPVVSAHAMAARYLRAAPALLRLPRCSLPAAGVGQRRHCEWGTPGDVGGALRVRGAAPPRAGCAPDPRGGGSDSSAGRCLKSDPESAY